jgi:hypothetical protein
LQRICAAALCRHWQPRTHPFSRIDEQLELAEAAPHERDALPQETKQKPGWRSSRSERPQGHGWRLQNGRMALDLGIMAATKRPGNGYKTATERAAYEVLNGTLDVVRVEMHLRAALRQNRRLPRRACVWL